MQKQYIAILYIKVNEKNKNCYSLVIATFLIVWHETTVRSFNCNIGLMSPCLRECVVVSHGPIWFSLCRSGRGKVSKYPSPCSICRSHGDLGRPQSTSGYIALLKLSFSVAVWCGFSLAQGHKCFKDRPCAWTLGNCVSWFLKKCESLTCFPSLSEIPF